VKYRRAGPKLTPSISRGSDSLTHLDGFCLIVSIVKAQAHTTHRIEKKKAGHHWPAFFISHFATPQGRCHSACPPQAEAQPRDRSDAFTPRLCRVGRGFSREANAPPPSPSSRPRLRLASEQRPQGVVIPSEAGQFFLSSSFLRRSWPAQSRNLSSPLSMPLRYN
jgi:hypothetical protein